ncbi:MAG: response regulator transcription factor [Lachnoclostridium sp.]|nr:response regulator transcription factor [Lachnoclostridium sp.]
MIAILDHDRLRAHGLIHLLGMITDHHVVTASSPDGLASEPDLLFVAADLIAAHIAWLMPRRAKVVAISSAPSDMFRTIDPAASDDRLIDTLTTIIQQLHKPAAAQPALSPREIEVLRLLASGCINKEIADRLSISINTVLSHRKNITAKLGIHSSSGLGIYALLNGLVTDSPL